MAEDVQLAANNKANVNSTQQSENDKSLQNRKNEETAYDEIRGNERHILFHFFTLFSISFVCGILLIHLSLWMNSYIHAVTLPMSSFDESSKPEIAASEEYTRVQEHEYYSSVYTHDETLKDVFMSPFYYTGTYFDLVKRNLTVDASTNYSNSVIK